MTENNERIAPFSRYHDITETIPVDVSGPTINGH